MEIWKDYANPLIVCAMAIYGTFLLILSIRAILQFNYNTNFLVSCYIPPPLNYMLLCFLSSSLSGLWILWNVIMEFIISFEIPTKLPSPYLFYNRRGRFFKLTCLMIDIRGLMVLLALYFECLKARFRV